MNYLPRRSSAWQVPVLAVSGLTGEGLEDLWRRIEKHRQVLAATSEFETRRREQNRRWMWSLIEERLKEGFLAHPQIQLRLPELEQRVQRGELTPTGAAEELLQLVSQPPRSD